MTVRSDRLADLAPQTLYAILRLRVDVFVVEQRCPYPELDGRDAEPDAVHWWYEEDGQVLAVLRLLVEPDGARRIGRVACRRAARSRGITAELLGAAVADAGSDPITLDAQSHLVAWYERFGFVEAGEGFLEDGIPHTPMRRAPAASVHRGLGRPAGA